MQRPLRPALMLGSLVAVALCLAACSSGSASSGSTSTLPTEPATTSTASGASSSTTASTGASTTSGAAGTSVQNLPVTPTVRAALTSTFVTFKDIPAGYVSGTYPNSVFYAYDPSTQKYWALAQFMPSSTASQQTLVGFQDGGNLGMYSMASGGAWTVQTGSFPFPCGEAKFFPATVMTAWGLPQPTADMQC